MADLIAAISTPYGKGGVAMIRISGDGAVFAAQKIFSPKSGKLLSELPARHAVFGDILRDGDAIDTGVATVYAAPASYTGEDTVEICCHGGILLQRTVLQSAFEAGCREAGPGEFTRRAFLNGKLALSDAEAVIDLIDAESEEKLKLAAAQSRGALSRKIAELEEELAALISSVYAYIDYPDEDLTDVTPAELRDKAEGIGAAVRKLANSYRSGRAVCEGIPTVIVGKPNVGKSSLLNTLLGEERAIVTPTAGTTRDTIEEKVAIGKVMLRLCDTAGIRECGDEIEKIGVMRAKEKLGEAELILAVFDLSREADSEDEELISLLDERLGNGAEIIPVLNKCDLAPRFDVSTIKKFGEPVVIGARDDIGLARLGDRISKLFVDSAISYESDGIVSNARQYAALKSALESIDSAVAALDAGFTQDIAGTDLELAMSRLGEVDGRTASAKITDMIFHRFCVGK